MAQDTMAANGQLNESTFFGERTQSSPAEKAAHLSCVSSAAVGEMREPGGAECKSCEGEYKSQEADPEVAAVAERPASRYGYPAAKRAFDVAFSLLVLVLLRWLYGLIAVASSPCTNSAPWRLTPSGAWPSRRPSTRRLALRSRRGATEQSLCARAGSLRICREGVVNG